MNPISLKPVPTVGLPYTRGMEPSEPKEAWRGWGKEQRRRIVTPAASERVVAGLWAWPPFARATHILTYAAFGTEIDLSALRDSDKKLYLTRTPEPPARDLTLHLWEGALERHAFGYEQPRAGAAKIPPKRIELALVPGLLFDPSGTRLGYGMGFYDRLLPRLRPGVPRVGITLEALTVERLPADPFDVPMTHLADETGVRAVYDRQEKPVLRQP